MGFILKLIKSRFFLISLAVALLLSIVPGVLCAMGQGSYVRSALVTVSTPFRWAFTKIGEGISGFSLYFRTLDELREENNALRDELEGYKNLVYDAELIGEENEFLSSFLGIKEEHVDFLFEDATVVGRESTNYRTVYTLSKGTLHGIKVNMPIITDTGLVGHITEVGATWSKAVLITETASAVGAYIERSGVLGIVEGTYELRTEGICRMVYIEPDSDIRVGDKVLTSGIGEVYPRGIVIGKVTEITMDENSRMLTALIEPSADLESISKLMIITEYQIISEREE
ncbi:MAG: rod shape-determining protein MreC [Clostridia bacterium]|nr:rod shape-determining protein MreC [Clostridia bacterium]